MAPSRKLFGEKALQDSHTLYAEDTDLSDSTSQIHTLSSFRKPCPSLQTLNPNSSAPSKRNMDLNPFTEKKKQKKKKKKTKTKTKTKTEEVEADSNCGSEVNALCEIKLADEVMSVLKTVIKIDEQYADFEAKYPYMASALEKGGKEEMMTKWRSIGAQVLEKMEDELKEFVRLELKARRQSLHVLGKLHAKWLGD